MRTLEARVLELESEVESVDMETVWRVRRNVADAVRRCDQYLEFLYEQVMLRQQPEPRSPETATRLSAINAETNTALLEYCRDNGRDEELKFLTDNEF